MDCVERWLDGLTLMFVGRTSSTGIIHTHGLMFWWLVQRDSMGGYLGSCYGFGLVFCLGGLADCLALVAQGWIYDELGAGDDSYLARNC